MAHPLDTSESLRRLSDADYEVAAGEYRRARLERGGDQ